MKQIRPKINNSMKQKYNTYVFTDIFVKKKKKNEHHIMDEVSISH